MLQTYDDGAVARPSANVHANARAAQETEYRQQLHNIQKLQRQLEGHDEHLQRLQLAVTQPEDDKRALVEARVQEYHQDPRNIAPEDALDTIVRLENHLKLQARRNALHAKELEKNGRSVKDRRKILESLANRQHEVLHVTGWDGRTMKSEEDQDEMKNKIAEMATLAKRLREEHRAAQLIIHKKEHVVQFLLEELKHRNDQRELLDEKFNAIRVMDRDNRELIEQIGLATAQNQKQDNAITVAKDHQDTVALECLRDDNAYLQHQLKEKKARRAEQDRVMRAQADRVKELTTRFEVIGGALRDLGLDRQASHALTAVPPAIDPVGEPDDMSRIAPEDEQIPTCMYELLIRDMASIRSAVARKDVMVVEKQCVMQAMQEKLDEYSGNLRFAQQQEAHTKDDKYLEMEHLRQTLADRHQEYRKAIDDMLHENLKLKSTIAKKKQGAR
jgi:hypothetical protein